jgi:hypothetical protein
MVEAALITPLLLLVTFGIMEFASILYCNLALQNGVAQATRWAVTGSVNAGQNRMQSMQAAFRQATPTLTVPDANFHFSHLPVGGNNFVPGVGGPGEVEKVSVDYTWTVYTPLMRPFFPSGQITLHAESAMKNESF